MFGVPNTGTNLLSQDWKTICLQKTQCLEHGMKDMHKNRSDIRTLNSLDLHVERGKKTGKKKKTEKKINKKKSTYSSHVIMFANNLLNL